MTQTYNADAIEVLTGLEPVRRRPGMYTDTTRPNHLGQEVIDNSVDEALAGHAKRVEVILHASQSSNVRTGIPVCCENSFLVIPTLSLSCFIVSAIVIIYHLLMHFYYCNIVLYVTQCVILSYALFQSDTFLLILSIYSVQ